MLNITFKGVIDRIFDSEIHGTTFEKRIFWLREQDVEFPNTWKLECHQGDCNILDKFRAGDQVECLVSIKGRKFQRKDGSGDDAANTLKAFKIVPARQTTAAPTAQAPAQAAPRQQPQNDRPAATTDEDDDLPF